MTGSRRTALAVPSAPRRPARPVLLGLGAVVACASIAVGCGVVSGVTGDAADDTITVMTWAPQNTDATNKPGMPALAEAYARWVNKNGGIDGRKLKVLTCNDHNDTVAAAKCARRAVDEGAVAVVGSYSQHGDAFLSPLESAGVPYIGGYGVTSDEFQSPLSYPVNGGMPALVAGLGEELGKNCGPVSLIRPDTIAGDELSAPFDQGLKDGGHAASDDLRADENATEYGTQSKQALVYATSGASTSTSASTSAEGCVVPALDEQTDTFMDSFRRDRADYPAVRTASVLGSVEQSTVNASGGASSPYEGSYITGWYPVASDARWDAMKKVINEEAFDDDRIDTADPGVQTTWIAYRVFQQVVESLKGGDITASTVHRALDDGLKVTTGGLTPTLSWRFEDLKGVAGYPRLVNADVTFQVVKQGRLVAARKGFVNVGKVLEATTYG
ncbi:hypothetical protein OK074_3390 [Actinobacteria bacterium OK074]|nr:hypothetical protein OK074_3390 [Actinobacteria bacterium OK074]